MANGMGQIIQLLSVLSEIQQKDRQLALQSQEMEQRREQFAEQMGFQKGSENWKAMQQHFKNITDSSVNARDSLAAIAQASGRFSPEEQQAFVKYGQAAPESLEMIRTLAANRGAAQSNPQMDLEAYAAASTGQNLGGLAQSGLQSTFGNYAQGLPETTLQGMGQGFAQRMATGETPVQAAIGQSTIAQPGLVDASARIAGGTQRGATAEGQVAVGMANVYANLIMSGEQLKNRMASSQAAMGMIDPTLKMQGLKELAEIAKAFKDPELGKDHRAHLARTADQIAEMIGTGRPYGTKDDIPSGTGWWMKQFQSINPPSVPFNQNPIGAIAAPPTARHGGQ